MALVEDSAASPLPMGSALAEAVAAEDIVVMTAVTVEGWLVVVTELLKVFWLPGEAPTEVLVMTAATVEGWLVEF